MVLGVVGERELFNLEQVGLFVPRYERRHLTVFGDIVTDARLHRRQDRREKISRTSIAP